MLNTYQEFILEQQMYDLLLESELVISKNLGMILKKVGGDLAETILASVAEERDLEITSNYLDIGTDKETISFINDKKAIQLSALEDTKACKVVNDHEAYIPRSWYDLDRTIWNSFPNIDRNTPSPYVPKIGEIGEIVSTANFYFNYHEVKFATASCVLAEPAVVKISEAWIRNRQSVRVGRLIRSLLNSMGVKYTDAQVEEFVNRYKSEWEKIGDIFSRFELVSGQAIAFFYDIENYELTSGDLGSSCMANKHSSYFDIYVENPEVCSMAILRSEQDDNKICGRALVWTVLIKDIDKEKPIRVMDRVYTNKPHQVKLFNQWAQKNGIYYKLDNYGGDYLRLCTPDGKETRVVYGDILLKPFRYRRYPYVDTFKYLEKIEDGSLRISNEQSSKWILDSVAGLMNSNICEWCGGNGTIQCSECDSSGEYTCTNCRGDGNVDCSDCKGAGYYDEEKKEECQDCRGSGKLDCQSCDGKGTLECGDCDGRGSWDCQECS